MLNRLFGNYLVNKKCITQEQLDSILPVSNESKASVEVIAVILKYMSPPQVQSLLSKIDKNTTRFGEAAVDAGYITDDRLDKILTYQGNAFMRFVQLLYAQNLISLETVSQLLDDFKTENQYNAGQMEALIANDLEELVNIFVPINNLKLKELALTLVQTIIKLIDPDMYLEKSYVANTIQLDRYAAQTIEGDINIRLYISGAMNELLGIANYFTSDTYSAVNEDALDNVGEFINCVSGLFATNMSYDDVLIDMKSPEYAMEGPYLNEGKMFVIPIHLNGHLIRAVLEVF